jgi:hypothetical protein
MYLYAAKDSAQRTSAQAALSKKETNSGTIRHKDLHNASVSNHAVTRQAGPSLISCLAAQSGLCSRSVHTLCAIELSASRGHGDCTSDVLCKGPLRALPFAGGAQLRRNPQDPKGDQPLSVDAEHRPQSRSMSHLTITSRDSRQSERNATWRGKWLVIFARGSFYWSCLTF